MQRLLILNCLNGTSEDNLPVGGSYRACQVKNLDWAMADVTSDRLDAFAGVITDLHVRSVRQRATRLKLIFSFFLYLFHNQ